MTPDELMLADQLAENVAENQRLKGEVAQLKAQLSSYEHGDTLPPAPTEPETGDYTAEKREAEAEMDFMRVRQSTMDSELSQIHQWMRELNSKIGMIVEYIQNSDRCEDCPRRGNDRPLLSSITGGKAE